MLKMNRIITIIFVSILSFNVQAQFEQISIGENYANQVYYSLTEGSLDESVHEVWDIAFTTQGVQDAGVFVNEGAPLGATSQVELYYTGLSDFNIPLEEDTAEWQRLYNPEIDWQNGAFNDIKDVDDVFDYGWGQYNSSANTVEGNAVYAVKLRSGKWKKIFINSLFFDWRFEYSNLDGTDHMEMTIPKEDHLGKTLAYYSLEENQLVDIEPFEWDLLFTRYNTYTDDGLGNFRDYVVTGVLSGLEVQVAEFDNVDPDDVSNEDIVQEDYERDLDLIGFDWKTVDINTSLYSIDEDRVYFVLNAADKVCKVQFIDFEGASTGVTTIEKECYNVAEAKDLSLESLNSLRVFSSLNSDRVNILADFDEASDVKLTIVDVSGRTLAKKSMSFDAGFQHKSIDVNLISGRYFVVIQNDQNVQTTSFMVAK